LAIDALRDIAYEERIHVGEFLQLLHELAPDEKKLYNEGTDVVQEMIDKFGKDK
jgi:rubrerythrin